MPPSTTDIERIERIVREVVKRLSSADASPALNAPSVDPPSSPATNSSDTAVILDRVVTVSSLQAVLTENLKRVEVQRGAVVTPSVRDLLRDKKLTLIETATARSAPTTVWIAMDGQLPEEILRWVYSRGEGVAPSGSLTQQLQWLESQLNHRAGLGLVVSDRSMRAAALANRRPALRGAVIATPADVATANQQMQANLLVTCARMSVDRLSAIVDAAATLSRVQHDATDPLFGSY